MKLTQEQIELLEAMYFEKISFSDNLITYKWDPFSGMILDLQNVDSKRVDIDLFFKSLQLTSSLKTKLKNKLEMIDFDSSGDLINYLFTVIQAFEDNMTSIFCTNTDENMKETRFSNESNSENVMHIENEKKCQEIDRTDACHENVTQVRKEKSFVEFVANESETKRFKVTRELKTAKKLNEKGESFEDTQKDFLNFEYFTGEKLVYHKSVFVAHYAIVSSIDDVDKFERYIITRKKYLNATHNIKAYIIRDKGTLIYNYCDDGEKTAGKKLLKALIQTKVENIVVLVQRWYGGIQLGPARFRLITSVAIELLKRDNVIV